MSLIPKRKFKGLLFLVIFLSVPVITLSFVHLSSAFAQKSVSSSLSKISTTVPDSISPAISPSPSDVIQPIPPLTNNDIYNYILGGTMGGTATASASNFTMYMQPNSRLATAGINEYNAAVALIYYYQFKAYIGYLDVVFSFGDDTVQEITNNIARGSYYQMKTPEADLLLRVAAVYRGVLCDGGGVYNNPEMKKLLIQWGRSDLASQPGVGDTDIESIANVAQAIDEQTDPVIRRKWLDEVYNFDDNLHPYSPSGAVPSLRAYQCAIDILRNGTFTQLMDNYGLGVATSDVINPSPITPDEDTKYPPLLPSVSSELQTNPFSFLYNLQNSLNFLVSLFGSLLRP